jgi:gliding motility-associated-like protein
MKQNNTLLRLFTGILFFAASSVAAQTVTMPGSGSASTNSCSMTLLDPGGSGNYNNNVNSVYTICSNVAGQAPRITFTAFSTEATYDYVYIYNGNSTASPLLGSYSGTTLPPVITGTGTCITIQFTSDISNVSSGFSANITCATPPPPPVPNNQDCLGAIPVCQSVYNNPNSYVGTGNYPNEISSANTCLGSGEKNDVWYQFTVQTAGNLCFVINPNSGSDDYDWAVFNLTSNNCADIFSNGTLDVSCDYSGQTLYNANASQHPSWGGPSGNGNTGMVPNQNALDAQMEPCLAVTAGQSFVLNVSNFSSTTSGYTLNFPPPGTAGMATIFDNIPPAINSLVATPSCGATTFSFNFSENVQCNTVSTADFTLSGPGGPYTVTNVSGVNCANGAPSENTFTVTTTPAITTAGTYSLCLGTAAGSVTDLCGNVAPAGCFTFTIAGPTVAVTPTNPNCSTGTGSVTATGSGGSGAPYTYSLNGGTFQSSGTFTGLAAGSYTVRTQDAGGCRGQNTFTITIPAPVTATLTPTNASCSGTGSITTTVAGGTPGYTYAWSPSGSGANPTGLAPGTYSLTVTDSKGCTVASTTTISLTGSVTSTFTNSANQCLNGNSFNFTNTGTAAATHSWTFPSGTPGTSSAVSPTGVTWATAGTYTVTHTVTSGSCTSTTTVVIVVYPRPNGPALAAVNPTCGNNNGAINVTAATGGTPAYQYNLNGGANTALTNYTGQGPGTYTVNVVDANGCTNSSTITLTNVPGPTALALTQSTAHCSQSDGSITIGAVTGGTAAYTYSFNNPAGPFTATSPITGLAPGTYSVTVKDANGCTFTTTTTVANAPGPTGPNAASTNSSCGASNGTVTLSPPTTGTGPFTYSFNGSAFSGTTNYTALAANTYTYVVKDNFGCTLNGTVTVNNSAGPTALVVTPTNASCGASNGSFNIGATTGGAAPYTYSVNGGAFSGTTSYTGQAAGTYTVIVKDNNGCTFTTTTTINNAGGPTALALSHVNSNCGASNGTLTIGATTGGVAPYTYSVNGGAFTSTTSYTGQAAGTYTVTVKDNNGCTFTTTHVIGNNAGPTAVVLTPVNATCGLSNGSFTIGAVTGGTPAYTYSINGGAFTSTTSYTGQAANTYTVTVKDANGCTFTATTVVGNTPGPTAVVLTPTNSTCGLSNGSFTIGAVTGGTAAYTYSVAPGPAGFTSTTSYNSLAAGTYTVTVKDANGCTFVSNTTINNTPGPTAVTLTPVNTSCGGSTGTLTIGAVTGGTSAYTYSVSPGPAGFNATTSFTALAQGTYTVIVKDANGCTFTSTSTVGNNPGPTAVVLTPTNSTCGASNGSFNIGAVTGGTAAYTYSVNGSAFTSSTSYTSLAAGTYTVTVKDANGCTFTSNTTINNSGGPTAVVLTPVSATCGASNGSFTIGAVTGGAAAYTYSVNGGAFTATTSYTGLAAGTYTVVVKDANGCTFSTTTSISNSGGPTAQAMSSTNSACASNTGTVTFGATTGGTGILTYSFNGSAFTGTTTYTNVAPGTYTAIVKDGNGCQFSTTVTVGTVAGPTAVVLTPGNSTCGNSNGTITVGAVTGGTSPYTYSLDGGAFTGTTSYTGLAAGSHTITVKDNNGCTFVGTTTITNTPGPTAFAVSSTNSTCGNPNGTATAGAVTTSGSTTFQYSINGGALGSTTTFTGLAAATYTLLVQDANGCTFTNTVTVTNLPGPTAQALTPVNATCGNANGSVTIGATTGGTGAITYSFDGGAFSGTTSYTNLAAGTHTVIAQDANGCQFSQTTVVGNLPGPTAVALTPTNATCGGANGVVTIGAVTGGTSAFTYSFNGSGFTATTSYTGLIAGTYTVVVKDANGCTFSQTVTVNNSGGPTAMVLTPTNATCGNANGSITVGTVTGGSGALTYSLNGGAFTGATSYTNLAAGTYTVVVKDANGCTFTQTTTIADTPGPTAVVLTPTNSTCGSANGSFTVGAVTGGTSGYTYSVNAGAFTATTSYTSLLAGTYTLVVKDANGCTFSQTVVVGNTAGPTAVVLTPVNSTCGNNNGQVNVGAVTTTGSTTFQYSIDGGALQAGTSFTGLSAATHTILVQDGNGCQFTQTVNVANTPGPTAQAVTTTNSTCGNANGVVTIGATTGGTPAYQYSFDGGAFAATTSYTVAAGTHTVVVRDVNLCTFTVTTTVNNTAGPTAVALSSVASNCGNPNGSVTVGTVTGGTATYQYSLNGGALQAGTIFPNLLAGTYTVVVTDANSCTVSNTVTVINLGAPAAVISAQTNVSCNGGNNGSVTISASGGSGSGYTYTLNTGQTNGTGVFSGLSAGNYTLSLTDGAGCPATATFTITQPPVLNGSIQTQSNVLCFSGNTGSVTVTQTGGTSPFTYALNGGAFGASATFSGLAATSYTVTVKDNNGCLSNVPVTITQPTAITLAFSSVNANCTDANGTATVAPNGGTPGYSQVWTGGGGTGLTTVPVVAGTYSVTVTDANGCTATGNTTIGITPGGIASISSATNVTCNGANNGSITVSMGGGATAPFTYTWTPSGGSSPTASNLAPGTYSVTVTDAHGCTATTSTTITQPLALSLGFTSTNVSCNGGTDGTINSNVTGGTAPYTYAWSPGAFNTAVITGIPAGTYSLIVTDANGCTVNGTRPVTQPTALTMTPVTTNPHCGQADGSATVTGGGGAGGYTFSLNGGSFGPGVFNNLSATSYVITIKDANNCTANLPLTLVDQSGPSATISASTNVSCNGGNNGSATVSVTGGTTPYASYVWTPSGQTTQTANNLPAGVYGVVVTDAAGCSASAAVTITQPSTLTINASGTDPVCNGQTNGTGTASAFGGTSPYAYQWAVLPIQNNANATGLAAGTHSVTVTDANGCTATTSINLVNPPLLTLTINKTDLLCFNVCNGSAAAVTTNGNAPFLFAWNDPSSQTSQTATGLCAGSYTVNVTDFRGCTATATTTITQPTQLTTSIVNPVNVTCSGLCNGSGGVSPNGGTTPYTYNWSNSAATPTLNSLCVGNYTATVTDANGCTSQSTLNIIAPNPLVLSATGTNATCYNICDGTATATFSGGTTPYSFLWQPSLAQTFNATALCDGTHTVTITDANGCTQSATVVVTEPSQLSATTSVSNNNFCGQSNGTAQVMVSGGTPGFTYLWNNGLTTAFISNLPGGPYSVDVTDANGCTVNAVANVIDIPAPTLTLNSFTDITCFGLHDGTAVVTIAGGTAPVSPQQWLLPGLTPNPVQSGNGNGTNLYPGNNVFQVVDAAGCVSSITIPIAEPTQLVSALNNINNVTCNGLSNGSATMLLNGGTTPYTYQWTDVSAQTTATASSLAAGTYTCNVTDANGCPTTQSVTITQPLPLVIINNTVSNVTCYGDANGLIDVTPNGGTPGYSYSWSPNSSDLGPVVTNLGPGIYQLQVSDSKGCTQNSAYNITQPDSFIVNIQATPSHCSGANGSIHLIMSGATPGYTYSWNTSPVQTGATANNLLAPASYNCIVTDANGCTKSITASIGDLPAPTIDSITVTNASCFGFNDGIATVYPKAGGSSVFTYQWNLNSTVVSTSQAATSLNANLYNITVTDANGCTVTGVTSISEPLPITINTSTDQTACNGQVLGVYASAAGGTLPYTYTWLGAGSGLSGGGNHNVTFTNGGTVSVIQSYSVNATDVNGCPAAVGQFNVTVLPKITILAGPVTGCLGQTVTLNAEAFGGNNGPYTFTWGTVPVFTETGTVSQTQVDVTSLTSVGYNVAVDDGCSTVETVTVTVGANPTPNATLLGINTQGCSDLMVTFSPGNPGITGCSYAWSFGDGLSSTDSATTHLYSTIGSLQIDSFDVQLIVTSPQGCKDTVMMPNYVAVYPQPVAEFSFLPETTTEFDPTIHFFNQSLLGSTYNWNFGEPASAMNVSVDANPSHSYINAGVYDVALTVTSALGCVDSVHHPVTISPEYAIYVPNAFSPNGDLKNEIFTPQGIGIDEERYHMYIYDRWGEVIYETNNFDKGWNGTVRDGAAIVQQDVYIYKIVVYDVKNNKHTLTGHVTVVR